MPPHPFLPPKAMLPVWEFPKSDDPIAPDLICNARGGVLGDTAPMGLLGPTADGSHVFANRFGPGESAALFFSASDRDLTSSETNRVVAVFFNADTASESALFENPEPLSDPALPDDPALRLDSSRISSFDLENGD